METIATTIAVRNTTIKAKLRMMRRHFHNSLNEIYQDASNKIGGKKIKNTYSGSISISGIPGIKQTKSPAKTSITGYATFNLLDKITIITMAIAIAIIYGKNSSIKLNLNSKIINQFDSFKLKS